MATLFERNVRTINQHIETIYKEDELNENSVIRKLRITAKDGKTYDVKHYNLDMILSVGYRVSSKVATQFRQWATQVLKSYIQNGFAK